MTATAAAVQDRLAAPGGGLLRHEKDTHAAATAGRSARSGRRCTVG